jgi:hypothetical protein
MLDAGKITRCGQAVFPEWQQRVLFTADYFTFNQQVRS